MEITERPSIAIGGTKQRLSGRLLGLAGSLNPRFRALNFGGRKFFRQSRFAALSYFRKFIYEHAGEQNVGMAAKHHWRNNARNQSLYVGWFYRKEMHKYTMTTPTLLLEEQMQHDRFARAQTALWRGDMRVQAIDACTWTVASKENQYTVQAEGEASRKDTGTVWTCTCPDFTGRCQRFGLVCKHIGAVQIYTSETNPVHMEDLMTNHTQVNSLASPETGEQGQPALEDLIDRLRQPLDMSRVKRRQAPGQGTVPYLEGFDVLEMANDLFQFRWSFDLLGEPQVMRWDRQVTIYDQQTRRKVPLLGEDGRPVYEPVGICYITGRVQVELGEGMYSHADVGRCVFSGDSPEALDMAIAGAATDCLKRCFRQMGEQFGLSLYDKEVARTAGIESEGSNGHESNGNGRSEKPAAPKPPTPTNPTTAQPTVLQYRDGVAVEASNTAEVEAFTAFQSAHQGLAPASREVLRAWAASRNGK